MNLHVAPCDCCLILDNDERLKPVSYCNRCDSFLCERCRNSWGRRTIAAILKFMNVETIGRGPLPFVVLAVVLAFSGVAQAQNECGSLQPISALNAADTLGIVHKNACWNPATSVMTFPTFTPGATTSLAATVTIPTAGTTFNPTTGTQTTFKGNTTFSILDAASDALTMSAGSWSLTNLASNANITGSTNNVTIGGGGSSVTATTGQVALNSVIFFSAAPTISSGFGTSPSVVSNVGPAAFTINVGTGGAATSGVIGLPTAPTGWSCMANDQTTTSATVFITKQTASSVSSVTIGNFSTAGTAAAWTASDVIHLLCTPR